MGLAHCRQLYAHVGKLRNLAEHDVVGHALSVPVIGLANKLDGFTHTATELYAR